MNSLLPIDSENIDLLNFSYGTHIVAYHKYQETSHSLVLIRYLIRSDSSDGCGDSNGNSTTIADGRPGTASIDDSTCTKTGTAERTVMNTGTAEGTATKTRTTEGTATKTGAPKGTAPNTSGAEGTTTKTDASALPILHIHEVDSNTQLTDCTEDQSLQHRTSPCLSVETQVTNFGTHTFLSPIELLST